MPVRRVDLGGAMRLHEWSSPSREGAALGDHGLRLFRAILVIRWLSLVVALAGYLTNLRTHEMNYGFFLPVLGFLAVYTALLSYFSERAHDLHESGHAFILFDFGVTFAAFALTGRVWTPFLAFGVCSLMLAGLHATKVAGPVAGVALSALFAVAVLLKRMTPVEFIAAGGYPLALVYSLEFIAYSTAWGYAVRLLARTDSAYASIAESSKQLEEAHAALDDRQHVLLTLNRLGQTVLLTSEPAAILAAVSSAAASEGFGSCRAWLLHGTTLRPVGPETEAEGIDVHSSEPLAVAARDARVVALGPPDSGEGTGASTVLVPILVDRSLIGVVELSAREGEELDARRLELAEMLVEQLALGLERLRLADRARELAVVDERDRLTSEIHGLVLERIEKASSLAAYLLKDEVPDSFVERLRILRHAMLAVGGDLRFSILNWRSLEWEGKPRAAVERYVEEFSMLSGIPVELEVRGKETTLAKARLRDLLRIVQEALSNVWRHASAGSVRMGIAFEPEGVSVTVSDDGCGFDTARGGFAGSGLRTIRGRGQRHGGRVEISSTPGVGTLVRVWMPCQ